MFFKIVNNLAPFYLCRLLPLQVRNFTAYPMCNAENYRNFNFSTLAFKKSFFPLSIDLWNQLPINIREIRSLSTFKLELKKHLDFAKHQKHFSYGKRPNSTHHTRMRIGFSQLNYDLSLKNCKNNDGSSILPFCTCSASLETYEHFFLTCAQYVIPRNNMFNKLTTVYNNDIRNLPASHSIRVLLHGDENLSYATNCKIFDCVEAFIAESKRFK